jgi:hypothetical protein
VLVPSCDAYADLWRPFWTLFWRHWPECPFPAYLGSDGALFHDPRVTTLPTSGGRLWTKCVREQLRSIDATYVLVMLDDFFMRSRVNASDVTACLDAADALGASMIRLVPRPGPDVPVDGYPNLGRILPGAPYCVSTQGAIWRREALLDLLREDESIWEFEMRGSERSAGMADGFYAVYRPVLTYGHHVVQRGQWFPWEARRFGRMNIGCDFSRRKVMSGPDTVRWMARKSLAMALDQIPWQQRIALTRWVKQNVLRVDRASR